MSNRTRDILQIAIVCAAFLGIAVFARGADMYPNEVWPADATVETLNSTTDQATGLDYIAEGVGPDSSPTLRVRYDRRLQRQNAILAAVNQGRVVDEGGLKFGVYPLTYYQTAARKRFTGATNQAVADGATTYVWIDSANALQTGSGFPADTTTFLPLAKLVTAAGVMTITDERPAVLFSVPSGVSGSFAASGANSDITSLSGLTTPLSIAQGGTGLTTDYVVPYSPTFFLTGGLSVKTYEFEFICPVGFVCKSVTASVFTNPTGSTLIVDVLDNGTSIFTSQATMVNIVSGGGWDTSAFINHTFGQGNVIKIQVEQVGSTIAGSDLTLVLDGRAKLKQ